MASIRESPATKSSLARHSNYTHHRFARFENRSSGELPKPSHDKAGQPCNLATKMIAAIEWPSTN
jgi:hypothetical protein